MERTKVGRYPDKTIFQITAKGKELFDSLQEKAFLGLFPYFYGFKIALKFNTRRSAEEIKKFAERAIDIIDQQFKAMADFFKGYVDKGWLGVKTGRGFYTYPNPAFQQPGFLTGEKKT